MLLGSKVIYCEYTMLSLAPCGDTHYVVNKDSLLYKGQPAQLELWVGAFAMRLSIFTKNCTFTYSPSYLDLKSSSTDERLNHEASVRLS